MEQTDIKQSIKVAIKKFQKGNLTENALSLFKTLGYNIERQQPFGKKTYAYFKELYLDNNVTRFNKEKALVHQWNYIDLLFQLSKNEISPQLDLFDTKQVDRTIIETYLFFTIELKEELYNRTALSQITREINKVFPMPIMVLLKHGKTLTLSVINRRLHKRDEQKDVLEKVTLIQDISTENPYRAHIEILFDLSFDELLRVHKFSNFVELHNAWQKTFDIKELNKRFYKELSNWYFWAMRNVYFPDASPDADTKGLFQKDEKVRAHNAKNLIRLLTRILFVWFTKEKNLIPDELFDESFIKDNLLKSFEPRRKSEPGLQSKESKYYRAILQNLFFATLNQTVGKREFRKIGKHMNVTNLMRYESYFKDKKIFLDIVEKTVPFMNGGLFECLDKPSPDLKGKKGGDVIVYEDGFSDRPDNELCVPDYIFFGTSEHADLSEELGNKNKDVEVKGLLNIFKSYKFTITENTPIEEDIALDPELLGKVFENLLASYNPETKTTARKQTGSFYTPREIVSYMVDESLIAYLKRKMDGVGIKDKETDLRDMISYSENPNPFSTKETAILIEALDTCKILDPACGSGAFPMGILHKLVHILGKLDPKNELWKEKQIQKANVIDDDSIRDQLIEDIETAFNNNELDYGRKLYLIENCIYGVDIQPIASQISKLRCFISLIVDERVDKTKDNFGVRPLPNLETKFVAANTLIGIEKPKGQLYLINDEVNRLENQLKGVRHRLFSAKTPVFKRKLREDDKTLREKMGDLLVDSGWENKTARQLASWDPYDQNASSPFFDPEWMFGITDGFDVVIGNPPYVRADSPAIADLRQLIMKSKQYITLYEKWDLMVPFFEKSMHILRNEGVNAFIASNSITTAKFAYKLQDWIIENFKVKSIDYFEDDMQIFEAGVVPVVTIIQKTKQKIITKKIYRTIVFNNIDKIQEVNIADSNNLRERIFKKTFSDIFGHNKTTELLGNICYISYGLRPNSDERYWKGEFSRNDVVSSKESEIFNKSYIEGKNLKAYKIEKIQFCEWGTDRVPRKLARPTFPDLYTGEKLLIGVLTGGTYDNTGMLCNHSIVVLKRFNNLKKVNNRSISSSISKNNIDGKGGKTKTQVANRRNELEKISLDYSLKYLLAVINSKYAIAHLNNFRKHRLKNYFYPDDYRNYPIPKLSHQRQNLFILLVNFILLKKKKNENTIFFESLIDAMVFELYFYEEIKSADCEVFKHINNLPEFKDDWSDGLKLKTIEKIYKELSDPAHPVSIAMGKMKTVPEMRVIEGLNNG